jgi:glutamate--cysteine ligase
VAGRPVQEVAKDLVAIAAEGLKARDVRDAESRDETRYLERLFEIADSGLTQADRLLEKFNGPWAGDIRHAFEEQRY